MSSGSVRLVNGGSRCAGRVEVLQDGQWGTVCDDGWDLDDAAVVCRELHCGDAVDAPQYSHFGPGSGPIWMDEVACGGSESTLKNCRSDGWGVNDCNHGEDAGVTCSGHRKPRLSAGPHRCSGRVEVFHGRSWSTVCDADFDQQDAEVVCRELGCGIPVEVLGSAAFGRGEGQVWTEELQCRGTESEITFCPTSSSLKHSTCSHDNDVGLKCSAHTGARLVNGPDSCSGRVELQYLSEWGTVCAVSWDRRATDVLCAQLDCGSAVAVVEVDWFGEGRGPIWADVFDCQGNETHLSQCGVSSWSRAACSHQHDAGVICNGSSVAFHEGRVRLSRGSECQGEVEIYFRQDWRRVLLDSWSLSEVSVLCRQLGCGSVLNYRSSPSTTEHKHMCVTGFSCSGTEAHLGNCSRAQNVSCSSGEQLYITCSDPRSIRLVGSGGDCAGRLEVFHSGSWGTVCDHSWDIEDAQVVCRQLQCGEALSTHIPAWFGPGTGSIWLNEVECEGNETSLWNCRFQRCEEGECGHQEDVGVVCSEFKEIRLTEGCEGNLEVFYNGTWGNVCHNQMDDETADMVCRELNCGRRGSLSNTAARVKYAPNWLDYLKCRKHDSNLWQCPSSPWGQNRCDNGDEVVHITCTGGWIQTFLLLSIAINCKKCSSFPSQKHCSKHWSLRLRGDKGSCSGRLEVYHNATWGSVCDDQWNIRNAQVVCRQLGCGSALRAERNVPGPGEGTIWLNRVKCRGDEIHLWDCHHSLKIHTDCSHAGVTCAGSVRLVNGGSRCAGRVEVLQDGQWGTVCGDDWDLDDAAVVCGELGCGEPVNAPQYSHFGPGSGPIWLVGVQCRGSELTLKNCRSYGRGDYCGHGQDAGVTCSGQGSRLSAGPHRCSGRVEVLHGGSWSTVCDADFDQQDAEVVCRELGCGIPVEVLGSAAFGRGEGQVWTEELQCRGTESEIYFCPTSSSLKHSTCSHDNDVGLKCSGHTGARLVNGLDSCSGRVELQYLSEWGTVCAVSWDRRAADVLCAQLDCGSAVAVVEVDWFGEGRGHIWADVFDCQGNETHLSQCGVSSWNRAACSHQHDAGVICNGSSVAFHEGRVRLSGGSECQGEVEIYFRQDWRRVLLDSWSLSEASVVCRQLGCGSVLNYRSSPSTTEHKHMCVTGFSCSGTEAHLGNCSRAQNVSCSSREQLYITCSGKFDSDPRSIRLVGSGGDCAGRLEVFHSGSWGTVCDDSWDIEDAQVVCRQLQCGEALSTHIPAWFGPGTGSIWLNEVECEGNETSLWNCRFQRCEEGECGHQEDVGVVCSEFKEIRLTEGCEGNLEVFYNGTWGNVCHNQMEQELETADMVCRELNCGRRERFDSGRARVKSAPNWLDHLKCRKHDSNLWQCPSSPWGQNRCDNGDEVVHITCTGGWIQTFLLLSCSSFPSQKHCSKRWSLRLRGDKGSCSGRLEVYHNATWGSVCDDQWNIRNAQVVCRQLDCGSALRAERNVPGPGEGTIWLNRVKCRGDEIHLWDCHHSLKNHTDCSHAGVTCADISTVSTTIPITTTTTSGDSPEDYDDVITEEQDVGETK
ncbi:deleted in malignant brain tumors 1 protein-like [Neoarius graeffei]|uniref:deleted in malignant brain tumors 1 protein-like n=1 Tax=Neoarius graeffei TaxID=443677 RepID=UPI00298C0B55|nr:deleted in malignant brain tumors 1 protein-like [Neoarius graeffei]